MVEERHIVLGGEHGSTEDQIMKPLLTIRKTDCLLSISIAEFWRNAGLGGIGPLSRELLYFPEGSSAAKFAPDESKISYATDENWQSGQDLNWAYKNSGSALEFCWKA